MGKCIMVQGTMSNAGKSLIVAGLCRIFKQDGYKAAPFKSQNMALNSYITEEGLEMGRAQVMQAEAAGIKPSILMNPILLKPTNDIGSQVIVNGEVLGNMNAREYFRYKSKLIPYITSAYTQLENEYDIIVIEGAGSPAEINLKSEDIVNMGMAKIAKSPVLLVGDIDRGGVFAQLIGTIMLLEEDEKDMVKGLIINKFRGDKSLLDSGVTMLEDKIKIPVIGVTPYMNIDIEDEDSLSERFHNKKEINLIDIAVIRLPHISNFTDFNVLECMEGVSLRYVHSVSQLKSPDMIILPGSKNTMSDMLWIRQNGLETAIFKAKSRGCVIFGICGGFQMLGETLNDPEHIEEGGMISGMKLLPMNTVFTNQKVRTRVKGHFSKLEGTLKELSDIEVEGYEIHMGVTVLDNSLNPLSAVINLTNNDKSNNDIMNYGINNHATNISMKIKTDGAFLDNVYGTYIHGIFDKKEVNEKLISSLAHQKGISMAQIKTIDFAEYKEKQFDILADTLRKHVDMKKIYEIMEMEQ